MENTGRPYALITGGSSGIGFELARQFALHGYDILLVAEKPERLTRASGALVDEAGIVVDSFAVNLATRDGVDSLWNKIHGEGRPVDVAVINAGVGVSGYFATDTDLEEELNLLNLNVVSTVQLSKHLAHEMAMRRQGRILFTASVAALMPSPFEAVYGASKAFVLSFAESLRNELKDFGVTVTAVLPGPTETNFFHRAGMDNTKVGQQEKDNPEQVAAQAYKALMNNDAKVIAGSLTTKAMGIMAEVLPSSVSGAQHRRLSEPNSGR